LIEDLGAVTLKSLRHQSRDCSVHAFLLALKMRDLIINFFDRELHVPSPSAESVRDFSERQPKCLTLKNLNEACSLFRRVDPPAGDAIGAQEAAVLVKPKRPVSYAKLADKVDHGIELLSQCRLLRITH